MRQNRMLDGRRGARARLRRPAARAGRVRGRVARLRARARAEQSTVTVTVTRRAEVLRKARGRLDGQVHGAAPAPYRALDLIEGALSGWWLEEGYARRGGSRRRAAARPRRRRPRSTPSTSSTAARKQRARQARGRAAPDPQGRPRRRRADGRAARDALPAPAGGAGRDARPQRGGARQRARDDRGGARRAGRQGPIRRGQGALPRLARLDLDRLRRLRRLRPRARGRLRGARGQAAGLRRAARARRRRVRARDEHLEPLGRRQMGADVGIHFFNPVAVLPLVELVRTPAHRRRDARHRAGPSPRACASGRCSSPTRPPSSSTASSRG